METLQLLIRPITKLIYALGERLGSFLEFLVVAINLHKFVLENLKPSSVFDGVVSFVERLLGNSFAQRASELRVV